MTALETDLESLVNDFKFQIKKITFPDYAESPQKFADACENLMSK